MGCPVLSCLFFGSHVPPLLFRVLLFFLRVVSLIYIFLILLFLGTQAVLLRMGMYEFVLLVAI